MKAVMRMLALGTAVLTISAFPAVAGDGHPPAPHDQVACSTCHSLRADLASSAQEPGNTDWRCRDCHPKEDSRQESESAGFHGRFNRDCRECHSFHEPAKISIAGQSFRMAFDNQNLRFSCAACHNTKGPLTGLSDGHRRAAVLYHSDFPLLVAMSPSDRCLLCHSERSTPLPIPEMVPAPPRFAEHASHPNGVPVQAGQYTSGNRIRAQIDSSIVLNDGKIECQTCHCLTIGKEDFVIADESGSGPACMGCHWDQTD